MVARQDRTRNRELLESLALARFGQAYFSRMLNGLTEEDIRQPSLLPGWSRAHVIAHVGYNARAIARLIEWAESGIENPMYPSREARDAEIQFGASLSVRALRHLSDHAAVQLDVAWRDLPDEGWSTLVRTAQGREVPASETVWMRTREVWLHALDLERGGRLRAIPAVFSRRIIPEVLATWSARGEDGYVLRSTDTQDTFETASPAASRIVEGRLADLMGWATGRSTSGVGMATADGAFLPEVEAAPQWI